MTAAYRLNLMGFLSLPGMKDDGGGNFATLDAVEALKWVKKNIAAFRRRHRQGDDCRAVGRIAQCQDTAFDAACQRPVPTRDHAQQPDRHGSAGKAELRDARGQDRQRPPPVFQKYFPGKTLDDLRKLRWKSSYNDAAKVDGIVRR